jgi:hypothetical protein
MADDALCERSFAIPVMLTAIARKNLKNQLLEVRLAL